MLTLQSQVALALLLCPVVSTKAVSTEPCGGNPADVVFLLDTSNSIWRPDFNRQLDFVKEVVARFQITEEKQRVGVVTFSSNIHTEFQLNTHNSKNDVRKAIDQIAHTGGVETRTGDALKYMRQNSFLLRNGGREGVTKVGIVITDGRSSNTTHTTQEAAQTRSKGIHLFAVGVGGRIDIRELYFIASKPKQEYAFKVRSFAALDSIKELLAIQTCTVTDPPTTLPPTTTPIPTTTTTVTTVKSTSKALEILTPPSELKENPQPNKGHVLSAGGRKIDLDEPPDHFYEGSEQETIIQTQGNPSSSNDTAGRSTDFNRLPFSSIPGPCDTGQPVDLVFVIDEKNGEVNTSKKIWKLIRHVIRNLSQLGTKDVRVQFVEPCVELQELKLGKLEDKPDIVAGLDKLQVSSEGTPQLLKKLTDLLGGDEKPNTIEQRRKIAVYLTDGRSNNMASTLREAQRARLLYEVELFGVGIGHAIDPTEMKALVSCPIEDHLHLVQNTHRLTHASNQLLRQMCATE